MQSAVISQPEHIVIEERPDPVPRAGEALIQVMTSGICGTDLHILHGEYLGSYPVIPGHEFSGVITAVGPGVKRFTPGDRVAVEPNIPCDDCENCLNNRQNFCLNWQAIGVTLPGGMAQYVIAPEKTIFPIGDLPFDQAAFMEPLSCVIHGVERAGIRMADRVAVLGAGPIGLLMLQVVRSQGAAQVLMADNNPSRAELARQMGADAVLEDVSGLQKDYFDVVIDATGVPAVEAQTVDLARAGGTVLLFGVPPMEARVEFQPFTLFHKGLKLVSSYTSLRNSNQAIELIRSGKVAVAPIISHRLPLEGLASALEMLGSHAAGVWKVIIQPNG